MNLQLFGSRGSGSDAVEMALRAANLEYEFVHAASWKPESDFDRLLLFNPLGQVPTLILLDGTVLTESAAILICLGLQYPQANLLPATQGNHAFAIRGLVFIAANCYSAVGISDFPEKWTTSKSAKGREKVREAARAQLHRNWEIFADTFGTSPAFSIDRPGALAFLAVSVSRWSGTRQQLKKTRPKFYQSLLRLERHPAIAPFIGGQSDA